MAVEIVMPHLSDSMEEGTIVQWFVAEGDAVSDGQPLVEVETDKASVTYESELDGTVLSINAAVGDTVAVGAVIAVMGDGNGADPAVAASRTAGMTSAASMGSGAATSRAPRGRRVKASPVARRVAAELGVDLAALAGSGPHGRVIRADVERSVPASPPASRAAAPRTDSAKGNTTRTRPTRVQETVARRMAESRATVPDFELRCEVDMTQAVALRTQLSEIADPPPTYNDFIVRAVALALREFPRVNGAYRDSGFETYSRVNVGIAVAADDALLVPTIFDADQRSVIQIAAASRELAAKVRDGSVLPADLSGGTFSVSNLGMYGLDSFTAVINSPQAAILAVGSLKPRAVVDEAGSVVARPTVHLTLACDHRILYGADGARFLARVRDLLQKPVALLA
ncbi:MAG TPA: dihydrolipoamide acetyltransferase family protein [Solirubrobacteraceae bacterium]